MFFFITAEMMFFFHFFFCYDAVQYSFFTYNLFLHCKFLDFLNFSSTLLSVTS